MYPPDLEVIVARRRLIMWYGFRSASDGAGGGRDEVGVGGTVPSWSPGGGTKVNWKLGVAGEPGAPVVTMESGPGVEEPFGPRRDGPDIFLDATVLAL
jgi:hypothetical protein